MTVRFRLPIADCRLYAFVDAAYLQDRSPAALAESLCLGGADVIQWRAKGWPPEKVLETARELRSILDSHGVWLVINDHLDIAETIGADACHLGQEDFFGCGYHHVCDLENIRQGGPVASWRAADAAGDGRMAVSARSVTPRPLIGISTHTPEQARAAVAAMAGYVAVGPVYATKTKPQASPVTLDFVRWAAANISIPWFAIGGINLQNLDSVLMAGARRVCVVSAILNASDVRAVCREFKQRLDAWSQTRHADHP